jgi:hypothetical protein
MTRLALYWEEAQIIGALATAITFILILITFIIDRRREHREFLEKYKLAFLEYTHRQKELLAAFELKYLRRRDELVRDEDKYRIVEKVVDNYLKEVEKPSVYGLLTKIGLFDEEDLLRLTNVLTSNPFLRSDFKLTFNAAVYLLDRLNERLKELHGRIERLEQDRTAEVMNLADDLLARLVFTNLNLLDHFLGLEAASLFAQKDAERRTLTRDKPPPEELTARAFALYASPVLEKNLAELEEIDKNIGRAFVLPDRGGEKFEGESYVGERIDSQADEATGGETG